MKKLVIAEKPSVGRDLANVLHLSFKKDGYIEGEKYIVTWALGHLVELSSPEDYNKQWKHWNLNILPMIPDKMLLKPIKKTNKQFRIIKNLLKNNDISEIIIATDAGREGELVARWILHLAKWNKKISRLWISSQTDEAIKTGFKNLYDGKKFINLFYAAESRAEADWLIGLNVTRALTCKYNFQLSAGRVQTPTLSLIVEREKEIINFTPKPYWKIVLRTNKGKACLIENNKEKIFYSQDEANKFYLIIKNEKEINITKINTHKKKESAPLLYDLTELQRDANKQYNFSAKETLKIMQSLYEKHKVLTYPRTDSRYLTEDMVRTFSKRLNALKNNFNHNMKEINPDKLVFSQKIINNKKVTDHHAIIPTEITPNINNFTINEKKIYQLAVNRFIMQFLPMFEYENIHIFLKIKEFNFKISGKNIINQGWRILSKNINTYKDNEQIISKVTNNKKLEIFNVELKSLLTSPPSQYTEASLLSAMENAGKYIKNKELKSLIKETGLGTPATRADIIEKLISSFYIERKNNTLVPTEKGNELINIVPDLLKSPELTAQWEKKLKDISLGKDSKKNFITNIIKETNKIISSIKLSDKKFNLKFENSLKCPICGNPMLKRKNNKNKEIYKCIDKRCDYEQIGQNNDKLRNKPKTKKQYKMDKILLNKYGKDKPENETLGDLFDF